MKVEELSIRKGVLEARILRLIDTFEAETKTKVSSIDYYSSKEQGVYNSLKVTIEI